MDAVPVNYYAVIISAVLSMVVGSLWYGPLFGKAWMKEMGHKSGTMQDAMKKSMGMTYGLMFAGSLFTAWVLAHAIIFSGTYMQVVGLQGGLMSALFNWLGFVAPVSLGTVLWDGKSWKLWRINSGYYLVSMLVMGAVLSLWQ